MRCCVVSTYPPYECGIALYTSKLVTKMKGAKVTLIANDDGGLKRRYIENGIEVVRCWRKNTLSYPFHIMGRVLRERPDIVHIQHEYMLYGKPTYAGLFPLLLPLLRLAAPVIITMHSVIPPDKLTRDFFLKHGAGSKFTLIKKLFMIIVTKLIGSFSSVIIVHNDLMRETLVSHYKFKGSKVRVISHGVDIPEFKLKDETERFPKRNSKDKVIVFSGFIRPDKGVEYLLKALPLVLKEQPDATLTIAGGYHPLLPLENPAYISEIEGLIGKLKLNDKVFFDRRFVPSDELYAHISAADVVVFPYIEEGILGASGALATVALLRKSVVATRIPRFTSEIKEGVDGLLVNPRDERQLAEAIVMLLMDEELRMKLGDNLRSKSLGKTWDKVAQMTMEVYLTTIEGAHGP